MAGQPREKEEECIPIEVKCFLRTMFGNVAILSDISHVDMRDLTSDDMPTITNWERCTNAGLELDLEEVCFEIVHKAMSGQHKFFVTKKGYIG